MLVPDEFEILYVVDNGIIEIVVRCPLADARLFDDIAL